MTTTCDQCNIVWINGARCHERGCPNKADKGDGIHVDTWFERDRQYVALLDKDDEVIVEWWDGAVTEAVVDGFLDPRDYLTSAREYAESMELL